MYGSSFVRVFWGYILISPINNTEIIADEPPRRPYADHRTPQK